LTDDVKDDDYDIVITTQRYCLGYTITRMNILITGVYYGNEADRTQIRGRINRQSQRNSEISYITVCTGFLVKIHQNNYEDVKILNKCLQTVQTKNK